MTPEQIARKQGEQIAALKSVVAEVPDAVEKVVGEVARAVRATAVRNGHSIGIRVVRRADGIRITITGPHANRYRTPLESALKARAPDAAAQIRTLLTRKPR